MIVPRPSLCTTVSAVSSRRARQQARNRPTWAGSSASRSGLVDKYRSASAGSPGPSSDTVNRTWNGLPTKPPIRSA
jgi:hypothetical protein